MIDPDAIAVLQRFRRPDPDCGLHRYTRYVCAVLAHRCSVEDVRLLMEYYGCPLDEVTDYIVADRMGKSTRRRYR
jgi:hypothetical protein